MFKIFRTSFLFHSFFFCWCLFPFLCSFFLSSSFSFLSPAEQRRQRPIFLSGHPNSPDRKNQNNCCYSIPPGSSPETLFLFKQRLFALLPQFVFIQKIRKEK